MALQFGLVYGQMSGYEQQRSTDLLQREAALLVHETPAQLEYEVRERSKTDLRVILNGAALFDMSRNRIAGDIKKWPVGLEVSQDAASVGCAAGDTPYEMRYLAVEVEGRTATATVFSFWPARCTWPMNCVTSPSVRR